MLGAYADYHSHSFWFSLPHSLSVSLSLSLPQQTYLTGLLALPIDIKFGFTELSLTDQMIDWLTGLEFPFYFHSHRQTKCRIVYSRVPETTATATRKADANIHFGRKLKFIFQRRRHVCMVATKRFSFCILCVFPKFQFLAGKFCSARITHMCSVWRSPGEDRHNALTRALHSIAGYLNFVTGRAGHITMHKVHYFTLHIHKCLYMVCFCLYERL